METVSRVTRNTLWLTLAYGLSRLLNLAVAALLSRYLGPAGYGELTFAYVYQSIFLVVADLGLESVLVREASLHRDRLGEIVGRGIWLKSLLAFFSFFVCVAVSVGLGYAWEKVLLISLAAVALLFSPLSLASVVFAATLRLDRQALLSIVEQGLWAGLTGGALIWHGGVVTIVLARLVAAAFATVVYLRGATQLCRLHLWPRPVLWWPLLRSALPLGLTMLCGILIRRVDHLIVEHGLGNVWLGIYAPCVQVGETLGFLPHVYFASVYPLLSRRWGESRASFRRFYWLQYRFAPILPLLVAVGLTPTAGKVLELLLGKAYVPGQGALVLLIWAQVFGYTGTTAYYTCLAAGQFSLVGGLSVLNLLVDVALYAFLIPRYGIHGAALAVLLTNLWPQLFQFLLPATRDYSRAWLHGMARPSLAAGLALLPAYWLSWPFSLILPPVLCGLLLAVIGKLFPFREGLPEEVESAAIPSPAEEQLRRPAEPYRGNPGGHGSFVPTASEADCYTYPIDLTDRFNSHAWLIRLTGGQKRVLEVGCSTGFLSVYLIENGCRVVGIELDPVRADRARQVGVEVITGDAEDPAVQAAIEGLFDVILLGDVLEHFRDPWAWLRQARSWLAPGGHIVLSIPNAGHWAFCREVFWGRLPQRERGLFDRGHLHFFTRADLAQMAQECGYKVRWEAVTANSNTDDYTFQLLAPLHRFPRWHRFLNRLETYLARCFPNLFGYQFIVRLFPVEVDRG